MTTLNGKGWALAKRPVGMPKLSDFDMVEANAEDPKDGEIQVRNSWMSVDPYMRGRMYDRESYVPPFQIGEVLQGSAVGRVTASAHPDYKEGDLLTSMAGWREVWTAKPEAVMANKIPQTGLPDSALLGVAGMPGLTAYAGLLRVADLKEGDTVSVDARDMGAANAFALELRVQSAVQRNGEVFAGLQFSLSTPEQWRAVVGLVYSRSQAWGAFQDRRTQNNGMAAKIGFLMRRSVKNGVEHVQAAWTTMVKP